jgi:DNA-binding transcriptional ArsR family regulator
MKTPMEGAAAARCFRALANPDRLEVFFNLVRRGERPVGRMAREARMSGPTLSRHLSALREAGLVRARRDRNRVLYSIRRDVVALLVRILSACC